MGLTHPLIPSHGFGSARDRVGGWPVSDFRPIFSRSIFGSNSGPPTDGRPSLLRTVWNPSWTAPVKKSHQPYWATGGLEAMVQLLAQTFSNSDNNTTPLGKGFTPPYIPPRGPGTLPCECVGGPVFDFQPFFWRSIFGSIFGPLSPRLPWPLGSL